MILQINGPFSDNIHVLMQRAGYAAHRGTEELSYVRRVRGNDYPRFHVYPESDGSGYRITIHADMKQHTYEGFSRHQGEYDTPIVKRETERLQKFFESQRPQLDSRSGRE